MLFIKGGDDYVYILKIHYVPIVRFARSKDSTGRSATPECNRLRGQAVPFLNESGQGKTMNGHHMLIQIATDGAALSGRLAIERSL